MTRIYPLRETSRRPQCAQDFEWPTLPDDFNWATDYLDAYARGNPRTALHIVDDGGRGAGARTSALLSYDGLSRQTAQVANYLRANGVRVGDRVLIMLPNCVDIFLVTIACIKIGATLVPSTPVGAQRCQPHPKRPSSAGHMARLFFSRGTGTCAQLLTEADLADRLRRSDARHVVAQDASVTLFERVLAVLPGHPRPRLHWVGPPKTAVPHGWQALSREYAAHSDVYVRDWTTWPDMELLLYFTSGTTSTPKMVQHTHRSYPVGHLTYAIRCKDVRVDMPVLKSTVHAFSG